MQFFFWLVAAWVKSRAERPSVSDDVCKFRHTFLDEQLIAEPGHESEWDDITLFGGPPPQGSPARNATTESSLLAWANRSSVHTHVHFCQNDHGGQAIHWKLGCIHN